MKNTIQSKKYSNMGIATAIMKDFIDDGNIRLTGTGVDISIEPTSVQPIVSGNMVC